jgi:glutathionyl-hydroquinone reductase
MPPSWSTNRALKCVKLFSLYDGHLKQHVVFGVHAKVLHQYEQWKITANKIWKIQTVLTLPKAAATTFYTLKKYFSWFICNDSKSNYFHYFHEKFQWKISMKNHYFHHLLTVFCYKPGYATLQLHYPKCVGAAFRTLNSLQRLLGYDMPEQALI